MITKRSKNVKQRGHKTHGWGSKKKHRGAGNRGGRGNAGTGKRADQKKPTIMNLYGSSYFGKKGFTSKVRRSGKAVNLDVIEIKLDKLVNKGKVIKEGDKYTIDVKKLGYGKVLANGKLSKKLKVISPSFSKGAVTKIGEAGGEVVKE